MKVTSNTSVEFPKLKWAISPGEEKDLPDDKQAQEIVLAHPDIAKVEKPSPKRGKDD